MSHNRIDRRFAALAAEGRAAFVAYVMAGDPDAATALEIVRGLPGAGADLIEIGFPFSDPMAEGPPIQKAAQRALKGGMTLAGTLDLFSLILINFGATTDSYGIVTALVGLYPVVAMLLGVVALRERLTRIQTSGAVLAMAGVLLVSV